VSGCDLDELDGGNRGRNRVTLRPERRKVQPYRLLNEFENFRARVTNGDATRQIRHVGTEALRTTFNDNCVFHGHILLQACLFQDTFERPSRHVDTGLAGNRNGAGLLRVSELTMTALRSHEAPTVLPQHFENVPDLHPAFLAGLHAKACQEAAAKTGGNPSESA